MTLPLPIPALPAELSIYTAAQTRSDWLSWLASHDGAGGPVDAAIGADASAVDVVDGAGVQLLLALARTLHERGLGLALNAPSRVLREACEGLGAQALLAGGAA